MADLVFVAIALAFFGICVLYVRWCDAIVGGDDALDAHGADDPRDADDVIEEVAA